MKHSACLCLGAKVRLQATKLQTFLSVQELNFKQDPMHIRNQNKGLIALNDSMNRLLKISRMSPIQSFTSPSFQVA
jgi:hypothetical protein